MAGKNRSSSVLLLLVIVLLVAACGLYLGFAPPEQWQEWLP